MDFTYNGKSREEDEKFILLLLIGAIKSLKKGAIGFEEAWNWIANVRVLSVAEKMRFSPETIKAIHLATELGDVMRLIPNVFSNSCDEVLELCTGALGSLCSDKSNLKAIHYYIDFNADNVCS